MSELDPELKRLLRWSKAAKDEQPDAAPFGLATRVAGQWRETLVSTEPMWLPRLQRVATWLSLAIVAGGLTFWASRLNRTANIYDFSSPYQLIAQNVAP